MILSRAPLAMIYSLGFATCAQVSEHSVDTVLVDQAQTGVRDAQAHPTVFAFDPETAVLQVREKTTLGLVVRVGNVVAAHRRFPSYLAYACHESTPNTLILSSERREVSRENIRTEP
ncbi:hypothetical protein PCAR4_220009 [Paraburkholderia caribensis]|nr:hypothetical protein PCAR4_220009 [Paraburkholderia caribensis]